MGSSKSVLARIEIQSKSPDATQVNSSFNRKNPLGLIHKSIVAACATAATAVLTATAISPPVHAATITWTGADINNPQLWSQTGNWTPTGTPGSGSYTSVVIGSPATGTAPAIDDYSTTITNLTINSSSGLAINPGVDLVINSGGYINDNGQITLNTTAANTGTGLGINGTVTMEGTGNLILNAAPASGLGSADVYDAGSSNLTQNTGHTISGTGQINVNTFINNGTVNANSNGNILLVQSHSSTYTNNNLMEATNGGTLQINGTTLGQGTNGVIEAKGGNVLITGSGIAGGTLTSSGTSVINMESNSALAGVTISTGTQVNVVDGNNIFFGLTTITNNGTITVNSGGSNSTTGIGISNAVELAGSGSIVLNANGNGLGAANIFDGGSSNLTQDTGHTISGTGQIHVNTFTNNGTVNANVSGDTLLLQSNNSSTYTNNNLMEATNGGTLQETNTTISQGSNGLIEANGGTVLLNGGTISGGTLTSTTGSAINEQNGANLVGVTLSTGSNLYVLDGNSLYANNGNNNDLITNNGTITVNSAGTNNGTGIGIVNNVELAGTGSIVLNANGNSLGAANIYDGGSSNLTQDTGHTISGTGQIHVNTFTNNGTVNANVSGDTLLLQSNNSSTYTNNNLMEATNGGTLQETNTTISQGSNGLIEANDGTVLLNAGTISAGTLTSTTGSAINEQNGTNLIGVTLSTGSNLYVLDGNSLFANNGGHNDLITNNGTITVNKSGTATGTGIGIYGAVELGGSGAIVLNANGNGLGAANIYDGGSSNLTQDTGHTISGTGQIHVNTFTNNGTVNANVSGDTLLLQSNNSSTYTNNNLMEATNGGTLQETNTTISQGSNGLIEANGGTVLLNGGTISGGTLTSTTGSAINEQNGANLVGVTLSTGSNLYVLDGNSLYANNGNNNDLITNNGTITVNSAGTNNGTGIGIVNNVELAGTGSIVLNANGNNLAAANIYDGGSSNLTQDSGHTISGTGEITVNTFTNNGTVNADSNNNTLAITKTNTNNGTYEASNGGTLNVNNLTNDNGSVLTGGTYEVAANSTMILPGSITVNNGNIILNGSNTTFAAIAPLNNNEGGFHLINGASFTTQGDLTNSGTIETTGPSATASTLTIAGTFTQTAGTTLDNGVINTPTMNLQGGTLEGTGTVSGTVNNTGGIISPGDAPGTLTIGSLNEGANGIVDILLASLTSFDQLDVTNAATIAGTLNVTLAAGFNAPNNSTFDILTSAGLTGTFATVNLPSDFTISYTSYDVILNYINNSGPSPVPVPASASLLAIGALSLLGYRQISLYKRRRRSI